MVISLVQVLVLQTEEAGLINVQWCERDVDPTSGASTLHRSPVIDQIICEGEAKVDWVNKERRVLRIVFSEVRPAYLHSKKSIFFKVGLRIKSNTGARPEHFLLASRASQ